MSTRLTLLQLIRMRQLFGCIIAVGLYFQEVRVTEIQAGSQISTNLSIVMVLMLISTGGTKAGFIPILIPMTVDRALATVRV